MNNVRVIFMVSVSGIVLLLFGAGIYFAARYSPGVGFDPIAGDMPKIISYFVSAVNATLAANLGAILGISISLKGWQGPKGTTEALQWIAAGWYVLMLLLAIVFWGIAGFSEEEGQVVALLPEISKNGIGIFIAILAAVLGVQTALTRERIIREQGE